MIIPDANLLLYAYNPTLPQHEAAKRWWAERLNGTETLGMPYQVVFAFLRISTHPHIFQPALTAAEAAHHIRAWLSQPIVQLIQPAAGHVDRVLDLLNQAGAAGNLVADAHLAALAIEYQAVLHTTDADFVRFAGLRWHNPITGIGTDHLRRRP